MTTQRPGTPGTDKKLVKDVASEIERRRRRSRLITLAVILGLVIAAALYLQCGRGWGLGGGKGSGAGPGSGPGSGSALAAPTRCTVRVTKDGVVVDGVVKTRDQAVEICKRMKDGAVVTVTGDARQGDWDELRAALEAVGVKIYMRGQESDGAPADKPATPN
jgi:hypothetical protein